MSTFNRKRQIMEHEPSAQNEIIEMAIQAGLSTGHAHGMPLFLEAFAKLIAAKEREKFCVLLRQFHDSISLASDPSTIKARGEKA